MIRAKIIGVSGLKKYIKTRNIKNIIFPKLGFTKDNYLKNLKKSIIFGNPGTLCCSRTD